MSDELAATARGAATSLRSKRMDDAPPHRHQVHALYGRCLLRLQQYELLMKRLLATQKLTTVATGTVPIEKKLAKLLGTSTLGLVAQRFFETFIVVRDDNNELSHGTVDDSCATELTVITTVHMEMTREDYNKTKESVAALVELRNELAHHFLERFDGWSEAGCAVAATHLTVSCERIGRDLEQLQGWARSMDDMRRYVVNTFDTSAGQGFSFTESGPPDAFDRSSSLPKTERTRTVTVFSKRGMSLERPDLGDARSVDPL